MGERADRVQSREAEARWRVILAQQKESGQSILEFCKAEGIGTGPFYVWRRKLAERDCGRRIQTSDFVPVRVRASEDVATSPEWAMEIELGPGVKVRVGRDVKPARLTAVLRALRGKRC